MRGSEAGFFFASPVEPISTVAFSIARPRLTPKVLVHISETQQFLYILRREISLEISVRTVLELLDSIPFHRFPRNEKKTTDFHGGSCALESFQKID